MNARLVPFSSGPHSTRFRKIFIQASFGLVALSLLAATLWFAIFSAPSDTPLHGNTGQPMQMLMSVKVAIVDNNGQPAAHAIATLDDDQQVTADDQGIAYFEHVMLHDHPFNVVYNGEHYHQRLHVHTDNTGIALGLSLETRRNATLLFGSLLCAWMGFLVIRAVRAQRRNRHQQNSVTTRPGLRQRLRADRRVLPVSVLLLSFTAVSLLFAPLAANSGSASAAGTTLASLPVPAQLTVENDDRNAVLSWNGGGDANIQETDGVMGYKVSWGVAGQPLGNVQLTQYRVIQLQPLVNGQQYQATVQSMDKFGNVSNPSATINFTGNSARVDGLRSQMTGFFDDFNTAAGAPDELKWNVAYSNCGDPKYNAFFINTQFHAHSMLSATNCDRGQNIARPRQTFDFTGRTGTITFDFDGEFRRDQWYLDLVPQFMDIGGQINIEAGDVASSPGNVLRFHQNEQVLEILYINASGVETSLIKSDWNPYQPLDWAGLQLVPNVRRHWAIKVSQTSAEILINGKSMLKTSLNLPFSKATVHWNEFSYNTHKSNEPFVLGHWDNFGFDGPKSNIETHNYRTAGYGGSDYAEISGNTVQRQINIPDSLAGEKSERLMFTLQMQNGWYSYSPNDTVVINGKSFPMPQPTGAVTDQQVLVSEINAYTEVMNLPVGTLKTGVNTFNFTCQSCGITNVHSEIDFTAGAAPAYTQPVQVNPYNAVPTLPDVGPAAILYSFNGTQLDIAGTVVEDLAKQVYPLAGKVAVRVQASGEIAMNSTGKNPGIARVELWLDKKPIWVQDTGGAPAFDGVYTFDTTQFPNGRHELFFVAYTPSGSPSFPDYFQGDTSQGDYYPAQINISNANPGPTATPINSTVAPTATTAPAATATSTPTAKATNTPTGVPATSTPTAKPTSTPTPKATNTPTPPTAATSTPTPKPTSTATPPTATSSPTAKPTTPVAASNLLVNSGFENGLNGWYCTSGVKSVSSPVHSGTKAASFPSGTWDDCHQDMNLVQGKTYVLEAYTIVGSSNLPFLGVSDYNTGGWYQNTACQRSSTYTKCSLTFTAPRSGVFGIVVQAQQGGFRVDDVSLVAK